MITVCAIESLIGSTTKGCLHGPYLLRCLLPDKLLKLDILVGGRFARSCRDAAKQSSPLQIQKSQPHRKEVKKVRKRLKIRALDAMENHPQPSTFTPIHRVTTSCPVNSTHLIAIARLSLTPQTSDRSLDLDTIDMPWVKSFRENTDSSFARFYQTHSRIGKRHRGMRL